MLVNETDIWLDNGIVVRMTLDDTADIILLEIAIDDVSVSNNEFSGVIPTAIDVKEVESTFNIFSELVISLDIAVVKSLLEKAVVDKMAFSSSIDEVVIILILVLV